MNDRKKPPATALGRSVAAEPVLHKVAAVAARLDVSPRTVRRLIAQGDLPVHRIGRAIRISEDDLARFLAKRRG